MTGAPVSRVVEARRLSMAASTGDGRQLGLAAGEFDPVGKVAGSQSNRNRPVPGGPLGRPAGQLLECGRQPRQAVSLPLRTRGHQLAEFRHRGERTLPGDSAPATRMQSGVEKTGEGDDRTEKREQEGERRAGHRPDRHRDPERGDHRHDGKRRPCRRRVQGGESESLGLRKVRHPVSPAQGAPARPTDGVHPGAPAPTAPGEGGDDAPGQITTKNSSPISTRPPRSIR